jgi:hypothetical protein
MRFLHSLLYSLFIWVIGVLLGSVGSLVFLAAPQLTEPKVFGSVGDTLTLMLLYSAVFSFPAFLLVFICILILNPRKQKNGLLIRLVLSGVVLLLTGLSFMLFFMFLGEAGEFTSLSVAYFGAVLIAVWIYPLRLAARNTQVMTASHLTVAQFRSEEEKDWFQGSKPGGE